MGADSSARRRSRAAVAVPLPLAFRNALTSEVYGPAGAGPYDHIRVVGPGPGWLGGRPNFATRSAPPSKTVMRAMPAGVTVRTPSPKARWAPSPPRRYA